MGEKWVEWIKSRVWIDLLCKFIMRLEILVHVNSRRPRVEKDLLGVVHVHVNKPALEGRANKAVVEMLAEYFGVGKSQVDIVAGHKSKRKVVEVIY